MGRIITLDEANKPQIIRTAEDIRVALEEINQELPDPEKYILLTEEQLKGIVAQQIKLHIQQIGDHAAKVASDKWAKTQEKRNKNELSKKRKAIAKVSKKKNR